jgi:UDP-N-acetylglucosamine 2-epimerase (non-hydrolysing)
VGGGVTFVVGARPNFMKVAPVLRAFSAAETGSPARLVHTGQHYDEAMSRVFFDELGFPEPDAYLGIGAGSHGAQTARALEALEADFATARPELVVVAGDVNSTLAGALAAVKLQVPVAHIEAGLRSFDWTMPEEHNRRLTDHVSTLLFAHSASAVENLAREGIDEDTVFLVGNTMIDSLLLHLETARSRATWETFGLEPQSYGLVTLHRPALVDDPRLLATTATALAQLADSRPLVFPVHPRTERRLESLGLGDMLAGSGIVLTPPLGYLDFLALEAAAQFVLTDSGGVQEETTILGVRCFTLRDSTERPITVELGTNTILGSRPERIEQIPELLDAPRPGRAIPLWDGHAGERCASVITDWLVGTPGVERWSA